MALSKKDFLLTALPDIPFDGWTPELLQRTAEKLEISDSELLKAFPYKERSLALYFFEWATEETITQMDSLDLENMRVRDRIAEGVKIHFRNLAPHKDAVSQAVRLLTKSRNSLKLPKLVWSAADKIWWKAGDTSTDYNHYTKRLLLSGILSSSMLYWLNDSSGRNKQTEAFIDRRIENVMALGKRLSKLKKAK